MGALKAIIGLLLGLALSGCSGLLYYPHRGLLYAPERLDLRPEEIHFSSANGAKLFGWFFRGKGEPKALVVFFHGNAENLSSHYLNLVWMLEHSYDFFIFDYQGYGRSEGAPSPEKTVQDGIAALEWAHRRAPNLPLVAFGQSLGGAVALRAAWETRGQLPLRAIAVESTFPSYRSMGRRVMARSPFTWPFQWLGWLLMSDAHAPTGKIAELSPIPLLVIHGEEDPIVEFEMGERVFAEAGEPKEFWRIPGGRHTDVFSRQDPAYKRRFLAWITQHTGEKK